MAFAFVQQANAFSYPVSGNPSVTLSNPTAKNNVLVCMIQTTSNTQLMVDDGVNIWIPVNTNPLAAGRGFIQVWWAIANSTRTLTINVYGVNPTGGTGNYFQAVPTTLANAGCQVIEFSGNSQGTALVTSATATGTSTAPAASVTVAGTTDLIIGAAIGGAGDTLVETAGWTNAAGASVSTSMIYAIETTSGTFTPTYLQSAADAWGCIAMAFIVPGTGAAITGSLGAAGAGAQMTFINQTNGQVLTSTADGSGNYASPALESGNYVVQPQKLGVNFTPNARITVFNGTSGTNFTSATVPTNLTFVQVAADTMIRANENPLSGGGNWVQDGTPVPPWDVPLKILSNEAISSDPTVYANFSGPYCGNGISCWTPNVPVSQYVTGQIDACNSNPNAHASWFIGARQYLNDTNGYYLWGFNNGDGTCTIRVTSAPGSPAANSGPTAPTAIGWNVSQRTAMGTSPYCFWYQTLSFSLGDTFGLASTGNVQYILHNGVVIGNFYDSTIVPCGTGVLGTQCNTAADVQLSHYSVGHAWVTGNPVSHITDVGTGAAAVGSFTSLNFATNAGDGIVVFVYWFHGSGQTVSSVKDQAGNSLSVGGTATVTTQSITCYYMNAVANASNNIKATFSANITFGGMTVYHVPGGATSGFFDNVTSATTASALTTLTPTITTANANSIIFGHALVSSPSTGQIGSFPTPTYNNIGAVAQKSYQAAGAYATYTSIQTSLGVTFTAGATNTQGIVMLAAFQITPPSPPGSGSKSLDENFRFMF